MEEIIELFFESMATLTLNKLRTGLAILGIVIGIGSVITLISFGEATQRQVTSRIESLGANLLTIIPGSPVQSGVRGAAGGDTTLTNEDANAIKTSPQITTIKNVSPEVDKREQIVAGKYNSNIRVTGVTDVYDEVHKISMELGNFITGDDNFSTRKVVVLGPQVVSDIFPDGSNPIGQTVRINKTAFLVIGVTASKGGSGFGNQDDQAWIPLSTGQTQVFGQSYLSNISVEAKSQDVMVEAQNQIGYLLLARHKISDPAQADFRIFSQQDILNTVSATTNTFTALLSGIAAISLLVGGIGIMNIMLVTVTERTREIGLRKALGAKKRIITMQFLIESVILTFVGGVIGVIVGITVSFLYSNFTGSIFVISPGAVLLAFAVSAGTGILFGWYPAKKASDLSPIEALRYE